MPSLKDVLQALSTASQGISLVSGGIQLVNGIVLAVRQVNETEEEIEYEIVIRTGKGDLAKADADFETVKQRADAEIARLKAKQT